MQLSEINSLASSLLDRCPSPAAAYRLRRDVLREDPDSVDLRSLRARIEEGQSVAALRSEQRADGGWGRFHSMDSALRRHFPTTEMAVDRALALGLDADSPLLQSAAEHMSSILRGESTWSDRVELDPAFPQGVRVITAGVLSTVDPARPEIAPVWDDWAGIATTAFAGGQYSLVAEQQAERRLWGVSFRGGYLQAIQTLNLLGNWSRTLPDGLGRMIVDWLWNRRRGIGYLEANMRWPDQSRRFENWLKSLEVLASLSGWQTVAADGIAWLWERRGGDGLWDFARGLPTGRWFPLADSWRAKGQREVDHSTRVLILLRRWFDRQ